MNAEIIAVGTELLLGQIANTNAQFISHHLAEIGINVYYHTAVGDNPERLIAAVKAAEERADLLIFTGGLGPTKDDLTKEAIAKHLGKELVMDEAALHSIEQYFIQTGRNMTENNKKQALVLQDAAVLPNDFGMAPGMFLQSGHMKYMLLPGPPSEMQPMFVRYGKAELLKLMEKVERIESRVLRFFGIGESALEVEVEDLIENQTNPTIAPLAGDGEVTLRLTAKHESEDEALRLIQEVEDEIQRRVGEYFYGYENTTIVKELVKALKTKGESVAVAESLTGGLFQSELTSISGVSAVFKGGIICYSNEIKQQTLGVKAETLALHGAVSEQCAKELAENVRSQLGADYGISFTGVAGPEELEGKKPGTVWIGLADKSGKTQAFQLNLTGSRNGIRKRTVKYGCHYLLKHLNS